MGKCWATYIAVCDSNDWDHDWDGAPHEAGEYDHLTIVEGEEARALCGEMHSLQEIC